MLNAIKTNLSGLLASSTRLSVAAGNIVNAHTTSSPQTTTSPEGRESFSASAAGILGNKAYTPMKTEQVAGKHGGTRAYPVPVSPASLNVYAPHSPDADAEGIVSVPNVNEFVEIGEMIRATTAYEANAKLLTELDETLEKFLENI